MSRPPLLSGHLLAGTRTTAEVGNRADRARFVSANVRDCLPDDAPPVGHSQIVDLPQTQRLIEWALDHEGGRPVC